jgi:NTE family protein
MTPRFPFARALAAALCLTACAFDALAQAPRPKIGLVLGGGGARGGAHMGVLEVLEELRIPFDCVAGTSMGALVSGAFAAGVGIADMKETVRSTDWAAIFDDSAGRDEVSMRRKELDDRLFAASEFGVTREGLRYREGAVAGQRIKLFFNRLVRAEQGELLIEDLPLPLTLIATDIGTGERVAMRSGSLTTAMRASMSVPGAVAPVLREGRKLVDGGLVDNVPIQEVRERCGAEAVIAVNVGSPLAKPEDVTGVVSVVGQMVNLLTEQNVSRSLALLGPRDVYLRPELGDITAASFMRQLEAAEIGRRTALAATESLRRYSVSPEEYRQWRERLRNVRPPAPVRVDEVRIADMRYLDARTLRGSLTQKDGEPLDANRLDRDLVLLYSQGDLQGVDYSVLRERDKTILRVTPIEKAWGPDYLRFGLNLYSDFGDSSYNFRMLYRRTWLNALGGEWLAALQIGSQQKLGMDFYQPLDARQLWFLQPFASVSSEDVGVYFDGDRIAEYRVRLAQAGAFAGANLGVNAQAKLGWVERKLRSSVETGPPVFPDVDLRTGGPLAAFAFDTLDYAYLPTRGVKINADYFDVQRAANGLDKYGRAELRMGAAHSVGDFTFIGTLEGGKATHGTLPFADLFSLGGPRRLAGFAPRQILGDEYSYGRIEAQYRLTKPIPLLGLSVRAGVQAEAGRMRNSINEPTLTGWQQSFGAYLATNTALGPIYVGVADAPNGKSRLFFFVGTP